VTVVNCAWVQGGALVADFGGGRLLSAPLAPYRALDESGMAAHEGPHPKHARCPRLPESMYALYGLEKSGEAATEVLRVRLTPTEMEDVKAAAKASDMPLSDYARMMLGL
jgi:hypothetical protein